MPWNDDWNAVNASFLFRSTLMQNMRGHCYLARAQSGSSLEEHADGR